MPEVPKGRPAHPRIISATPEPKYIFEFESRLEPNSPTTTIPDSVVYRFRTRGFSQDDLVNQIQVSPALPALANQDGNTARFRLVGDLLDSAISPSVLPTELTFQIVAPDGRVLSQTVQHVSTFAGTGGDSQACTTEAPLLDPIVADTVQSQDEFVILAEEGISQTEIDAVVEGVGLGRSFVNRHLDFAPSQYICLEFRNSVGGQEYTATVYGHRAIFFVENPQWVNRTFEQKMQTGAHEYFHIVQHELSRNWFGSLEPHWLIEGSAEYVGYGAFMEEGILTQEEVDSLLHLRTARSQAPALSSVEFVSDWLAVCPELPCYSISFEATQSLLTRGDLRDLGRFLVLARAEPWPEAFDESFGITVEDFYTSFE